MVTLSETERQFIRDHLTDDVRALLLRPHPTSVDLKKVAAQITARQKARHKLPTWYATADLLFPPPLSVEQASSEATAYYKASLVSGLLLLDLTGGMGVDTWAFADRVRQVVYVEQQAELAELATHNLPQLGVANATIRTGDGVALVNSLPTPADWLYLDPHRRDDRGGKVVRLQDCEPDVTQPGMLTALLTQTERILLKASPLIDIDAAIRQLTGPNQGVESVHVVAVQGEVKEVVFILTKGTFDAATVDINTVNLLTDRSIFFVFRRRNEPLATVQLGDPQRFLYEPNAAVLKAGAFRSVAERFDLVKLAPNTHLYTSDTLQPDFPGRIFTVEHTLRPDRKTVQLLIPHLKANLTVRNFPQSVAELRKKLRLQEGGDTYIFATTLLNGDKRLLVGRKVNRNPA